MKAKPFAITLDVGSSLANKTGSWRTERAVYVDRLPPCNNACPAGENIQAWLYEAEEGDGGYERAWRKIMEENPFPAIMGRVCYHPCETSCNRAQLDESVGINSVERFLGDEGIRNGWKVEVEAEPTGKRVLIVGAGPSGLSAAYHLALRGHSVTIRDAGPMAGGMMRFGIPKYRLPRDVLDAEVQRIVDLGVELRLDSKVTDLTAAMREGSFDAAFLAVGAQIGKRAYIPAGSAAKVIDAVTMLHELEEGEQPLLGRRVAIYGGGNTAIDAARTAKRLGASDAIIVYRRNREKMPAHDFEVQEAEEEGVLLKWLSTIKQVDEGRLLIERMELDETGFPQPTGETEELEADSVVLALGQDTDLSLLDGVPGLAVEDGVVEVGPNLMTGCPGRLRGRRHGSRRALGDRRDRPRQAGGAQHRHVAARRGVPASSRSLPRSVRGSQHLVLRRRAPRRAAAARGRPPAEHLRGGGPGARRVERPLRGAPLHVLRQLLLLRQLLRRLPR